MLKTILIIVISVSIFGIVFFILVRNSLSLNSLSIDETALLKRLLVLKLDNVENYFSANQRQILLRIIINYFTLNVEGFKKPKSIEVFKEVFS